MNDWFYFWNGPNEMRSMGTISKYSIITFSRYLRININILKSRLSQGGRELGNYSVFNGGG